MLIPDTGDRKTLTTLGVVVGGMVVVMIAMAVIINVVL